MNNPKPSRKQLPSGGFFNDLGLQARLILRLLKDGRVNPFLKVLPFASVLYFVFPDLVIGPIDDAAVIWLSLYLFIELCPQNVVEEHRRELWEVLPGKWRDPEKPADIIDGELREPEQTTQEIFPSQENQQTDQSKITQ